MLLSEKNLVITGEAGPKIRIYIFNKKRYGLESDLDDKISALKKMGKAIIPISIHDETSLDKVKEILNDIKISK